MTGITLSGVDEGVDLGELARLREAGAEIGILFTRKPDGRPRYPSEQWIQGAVEALGFGCAVHLCGRQSRAAFLGGMLPWLNEAGRVQINGAVRPDELAAALDLHSVVITQHNDWNAGLAEEVDGRASDERPWHQLLVDGSGGRGIPPAEWVRPATRKIVGFAGGLRPYTLAHELPRIAAVAVGAWWVDMESGLRNGDDLFSPSRAWLALQAFDAWMAAA